MAVELILEEKTLSSQSTIQGTVPVLKSWAALRLVVGVPLQIGLRSLMKISHKYETEHQY